jgi:hypothetical protein
MTDIAEADTAVRRALPVRYRDLVVADLVLVGAAAILCWAAGAHWGANKTFMSNLFVVVGTTAVIAILLLPWLNLKGQEGLDHAQRMAKMAGSWVATLAVAHLSWELPWVLFHRWIMGAAGEGKFWSYLWWSYAQGGDARYFHGDVNVLALETGASIMGVTALVLTYLRHKTGGVTGGQLVAIIVLMTCEFYSTVIYVLSESYGHFHDVTGAANFVVKFGYGNILWLTVPPIVFLWAARQLLSRR